VVIVLPLSRIHITINSSEIMNNQRKIELLLKARHLLHKQENGESVTGNDIILAHDYVDMVLDAIVGEDFEEKRRKKSKIQFDDQLFG
jgi:uncharacterized protein YeeX (DUF496 family)